MTTNLRQSITNHLYEKGNYDSTVDDYLIDMIIENIEYCNLMKQDIKTNGLIVSTPNGNNVISTKMNPALNVYQMCQRNIHQAAGKLGINRKDRLMLKLLETPLNDDFDNDFHTS